MRTSPGYDFFEVIKWWAQHADRVLVISHLGAAQARRLRRVPLGDRGAEATLAEGARRAEQGGRGGAAEA
jgi:hypothetical protein